RRGRLVRVEARKDMGANARTSDRGTATLGMIVAENVRRKRKITITTSATVSISSNSTSLTDARIVVVRSVRTATWMDAGSVAVSVGSSVLMRSTPAMMLAPGWRCTLTMTAGVRSTQADWRTSSAPSTTLATSDILTGAPFLYATTSER